MVSYNRKAQEPLELAFLRRVKVGTLDECWPWIGYVDPRSGYGRICRAGGSRHDGHRLAYELFNGPIPEGIFVCHQCDNRPCCNPSHLFLGTIVDNRNDCVTKGRHAFGERQWLSKLTAEDVRTIRATYVKGKAPLKSEFSGNALARRFGVTPTIISRIISGKIWRQA